MRFIYFFVTILLLNINFNNIYATQSIIASKTDSIAKSPSKKSPLLIDSVAPIKNLNYKFNTTQQVPKRAAMYSALLPGLGQMYNKQYWKLPIVYGGLTASGYLIYKEYTAYANNRRDFIYLTDGNPNTGDSTIKYNSAQLFGLQTQNRNRLDKLGVYTSIFYALNIVDALVSAHLKNFDISKDISLHCKPVIQNNQIGFALVAIKK